MGGVRDPSELVFALCHEVRNLLAATRFSTDPLRTQTADVERVATARQIAILSERAGALVACVRPLLSPVSKAYEVRAADVLDGLQRQLDAESAARVEFDLAGAAALGAIHFDAEALHHLLLATLLGTLENEDAAASLRVTTRSDGEGVAFVVEDGATGKDPGAVLCGRALIEAIAESVLRARGGRLRVERGAGGTHTAFVVPAAAS